MGIHNLAIVFPQFIVSTLIPFQPIANFDDHP